MKMEKHALESFFLISIRYFPVLGHAVWSGQLKKTLQSVIDRILLNVENFICFADDFAMFLNKGKYHGTHLEKFSSCDSVSRNFLSCNSK